MFAARLLALALFALPSVGLAGTISLTAADGVRLSADHQGTGTTGVLLIHGHGEDRAALADLVKILQNNGIQVLSLDLRGHGASSGTIDGPASIADVHAAVAYMKGRGVEKLTIVGAGMGGNLGFLAAAADPTVTSAVVISPALNHNGVKASGGLTGFGDRPILMIVGGGDALATKAANMLSERMPNATVEMMAAEGSGSRLLKRSADLPGTVLTWVNTASKDTNAEKPDLTLEREDLETTGKKLGER